jgi:hypothetical protein
VPASPAAVEAAVAAVRAAADKALAAGGMSVEAKEQAEGVEKDAVRKRAGRPKKTAAEGAKKTGRRGKAAP